MPVSSEICAFQLSTGSSRRNSSSQWPLVDLDELLLGQRQRHAAAGGLAGQAQLADLLQQADQRRSARPASRSAWTPS